MIDTLPTATVLAALPDRPFLRDAARQAGIPDRLLKDLVASGDLVPVLPGVLVPAHCPDTLETRVAALRLVLPGGAAVCRITAAWLYGIDARPPGTHTHDPPLECTVPLGTTAMRRRGVRCYVTDLMPEDVVDVHGIPCVEPARTAIDLARWSSPGMGLGVLDAMTRAGLVDLPDLSARVERWRGDRYIAQARRLIGLADPRSESFGESWLRLRFLDAGFPPPQVQIPLLDEWGAEVRRLDLGYVSRRYAWEYDGEEHHLGTDAEAADRRRRAEIEARWGWVAVGIGKNLVLGPSMALEYAVGEVVGMEPLIRRRLW